MFNQMKNLMDMQKQAKEMKKAVENVKVDQQTPDGRIKITMNGAFGVESLVIDETLLRPDNQDYLQNMLKKLISDTAEAVAKSSAQQAMEMMKGMNLGL
jgi:DNA-binding YbaB/EbfC family protein